MSSTSTLRDEVEKVDYAAALMKRCESDLKHKLRDGERRDLLMDNTAWDRSTIERVVKNLSDPSRG